VKASPVKMAKIRIIDGWDARVGTECGRCGSLLVTGGHRNAGCNFGAVCGKSPSSVMLRGLMESVLTPDKIDLILEKNVALQYTSTARRKSTDP